MEELICDICQLNFHSERNKPIALPCGHTYCYFCLGEIWQKLQYIRCYKCGKKHFKDISVIPVNIYYSKLLKNKEDRLKLNNTFKLYVIPKSPSKLFNKN